MVVYHGSDRNRNTNWLKQQDVVITTYSTLAQEVRRGQGSCAFWVVLALFSRSLHLEVCGVQQVGNMTPKRWPATGVVCEVG